MYISDRSIHYVPYYIDIISHNFAQYNYQIALQTPIILININIYRLFIICNIKFSYLLYFIYSVPFFCIFIYLAFFQLMIATIFYSPFFFFSFLLSSFCTQHIGLNAHCRFHYIMTWCVFYLYSFLSISLISFCTCWKK